MRVGRVGVLDDHGLVVLHVQQLQHFMGGLAHVIRRGPVVRVPFEREAVDGLFVLPSGKGEAGAALQFVAGLGRHHHLAPGCRADRR